MAQLPRWAASMLAQSAEELKYCSHPCFQFQGTMMEETERSSRLVTWLQALSKQFWRVWSWIALQTWWWQRASVSKGEKDLCARVSRAHGKNPKLDHKGERGNTRLPGDKIDLQLDNILGPSVCCLSSGKGWKSKGTTKTWWLLVRQKPQKHLRTITQEPVFLLPKWWQAQKPCWSTFTPVNTGWAADSRSWKPLCSRSLLPSWKLGRMTCVAEELQWKLYVLQKDRQGWGDGELVPHLREYFGCPRISSSDGRVECLWVGIRGRTTRQVGAVMDHSARMKEMKSSITFGRNLKITSSRFHGGLQLARWLLIID